MIERVVRTALVQDDHRVVDVLAILLHNDSTAVVPVPARTFVYTDAARVEHIAVRENVDWQPDWDRYDPEIGRTLYVVRPTITELPPGEHHVLAVKVTRTGCLTEGDGELRFSDPMLDLESGRTTQLRTTVVFRDSFIRSEVHAPGALTTEQTATWDRGVDTLTPCTATQRQAKLCTTPRSLENAIAELHYLFSCVISGDGVSLADYSRLMGDLQDSRAVVPRAADFAALSWPRQLQWIERQLLLCAKFRSNLATRSPALSIANEEHLVAHACRELQKHQPRTQFLPSDLYERLVSLCRFVTEHRRCPNKWSASVKESELQRHLRLFLSGRGPVESEVQSSSGRIDFLLGQTPVELKCRSLGPGASIRGHLQQAAAYATSRGAQVACLLILDTFRASTDFHEQHPTADVTVHRVRSVSGMRDALSTLVVVFVVRARTTKPSALKGGRLAARHSTNQPKSRGTTRRLRTQT